MTQRPQRMIEERSSVAWTAVFAVRVSSPTIPLITPTTIYEFPGKAADPDKSGWSSLRSDRQPSHRLAPKQKHQFDDQNNHHDQFQHEAARVIEFVGHEL